MYASIRPCPISINHFRISYLILVFMCCSPLFLYSFLLRYVKFLTRWACRSIVTHWPGICPVARRNACRSHWNSWIIHQLCSLTNPHLVWTVPPVSSASICWSSWLVVDEPSSAQFISHQPGYSRCSISCTPCPMDCACTKATQRNWCHFWVHWI